MHPGYAGSVSPDPGGATAATGGVRQQRDAGGSVNEHERGTHTAGPNTLFLSWIRIHPILHPGTSQRFAKPPQESMGTSLLRDAKEGQLQPGKTCQNSSKYLWWRSQDGSVGSWTQGTRFPPSDVFDSLRIKNVRIYCYIKNRKLLFCMSPVDHRCFNLPPQHAPCFCSPKHICINCKHMLAKKKNSCWSVVLNCVFRRTFCDVSLCLDAFFCPIANYLRESPYQNNTVTGEERTLWLYLCFLTNIFFHVYMPFG